MSESINFYELLGVSSSATAGEIKRAYFAAVRKYPPERFPEEFKRVREAYDMLSDPETRLLYDTRLNERGFHEYFIQADRAYHDDRYEEAITCLQKALEMSPGNRVARNLMGLCYLYLEEYDRAACLFKKLTYEFPENAIYFVNLGEALLDKGSYKQAIEAFENSLRLDESNINAWKDLAFCYFQQNKYVKAREVLEEGIRQCGLETGIYLRLVYIDIAEKNMEKLRKDIARLEALAMTDQAMRENVAWALAETAACLSAEHSEFSVKLLEKAKKLNPEKELKMLHKEASKKHKLSEPLNRLKSDPAVHSWIKDIAAGAILGSEDPLQKMDLNITERLLLRDPRQVLTSVQYLQTQYPEIFNAYRDFFQTILDQPGGVKVDERKLIEDIRYMDSLVGRTDDLRPIALDDILIPPMQRVKTGEVGRNAPCPCGSGKKYKKCCLGR